jgi:glycosyltransferase involved in cell wall biosynthesis
MKVAIDSRPLTSTDAIRGIGLHTRELITHLKKIKELELDVVDFTTSDLSRYDLVHYQYFHPHFLTLPFTKPAKKVIVTIHDLIRLVYPLAYPPGIKGSIKFLLQKFNLKNIDAVITISETSKKDISRFLNINPDKIFVTYLAPQSRKSNIKIDMQKTCAKFNLPSKYVLYIGDVNYNKNLLNLAKACQISKLPLVIIGKQAVATSIDDNPENISWLKFLKLYKDAPQIYRLGYLKDQDFEAVFKGASVYCQPSYYEGFGLPVLESFERGVPVVASRTQALVEVGADACLYVDPHIPSKIADSIKRVVNDKKLATVLTQKGKQRLKEFSWDKTANQIYEIYKKILGN